MRSVRLLLIGLLTLAVTADAQRPNRPMGRGGQGPGQRRNDLEDEVRRGFAKAVRERVGLNDEQMQKLGPITRKFEVQRRETHADERDARTKLQGLVMVGAEGDSVRIRQALSQLMDVHKKRLAIDEAEQKELATIMSPLQLAKFLALQEQIRRRLEMARPFPGGPPDGRGAPPPDGQGGQPAAKPPTR